MRQEMPKIPSSCQNNVKRPYGVERVLWGEQQKFHGSVAVKGEERLTPGILQTCFIFTLINSYVSVSKIEPHPAKRVFGAKKTKTLLLEDQQNYLTSYPLLSLFRSKSSMNTAKKKIKNEKIAFFG